MNSGLKPPPSRMSDLTKAANIAAEHHDSLFRWAMALNGRDRDAASELVQQVYLEVMEGRTKILQVDEPRPYLFGIARRLLASQRRRQSIFGRLLRLDFLPQPTGNGGQSQDEQRLAGERLAATRRAMSHLSPKQAQIATLVFMEEFTVEEAAEVMGVGIGSARTHYHRAKERLATLLEAIDE